MALDRVQATAPPATPPPVPPFRGGQCFAEPGLFASMSVLQAGRWVQAQTNYWTVIGTVTLGQPVRFGLAVQTTLPGCTYPRADVELLANAPWRKRVPVGQIPEMRVLFRAGMPLRYRANGWAHFARQVVFTSPAQTGHLFIFLRARWGPGRFKIHQFPLTIVRRGK